VPAAREAARRAGGGVYAGKTRRGDVAAETSPCRRLAASGISPSDQRSREQTSDGPSAVTEAQGAGAGSALPVALAWVVRRETNADVRDDPGIAYPRAKGSEGQASLPSAPAAGAGSRDLHIPSGAGSDTDAVARLQSIRAGAESIPADGTWAETRRAVCAMAPLGSRARSVARGSGLIQGTTIRAAAMVPSRLISTNACSIVYVRAAVRTG
jgi:hypothetical protein